MMVALFATMFAKADVNCPSLEFASKENKAQVLKNLQKAYDEAGVVVKSTGKAATATEDKLDNTFMADESRQELSAASGQKHQYMLANGNTETKTLNSDYQILKLKVKDNWYAVGLVKDCKVYALVDDVQKDEDGDKPAGLTPEQIEAIKKITEGDQKTIEKLKATAGTGGTVNYNPTYVINGGATATANNDNAGGGGDGDRPSGKKKYAVYQISTKKFVEVADEEGFEGCVMKQPAWGGSSGGYGYARGGDYVVVRGSSGDPYLRNMRAQTVAQYLNLGVGITSLGFQIADYMRGGRGGGGNIARGIRRPNGGGNVLSQGRHWVGGFRRF